MLITKFLYINKLATTNNWIG